MLIEEEETTIKQEETKQKKTYKYEESLLESQNYFEGDELPAKVFVDKYALKDLKGNFHERTPDEMHWRLAKEFGKMEAKFGHEKIDISNLSKYGQKRIQLTSEKIFEYLDRFKYIIPQGSVMTLLGNPFQIGSLSNCIVLPEIFDSYGGLYYTDQQMAQLMKRRCGVGIDISTLRPEGSIVTNAAGSSTGPVSFMDRFSNTTREVAQSGRRGALMITIDIAHPDVEKFITVKQDLSKVTGANISVRLSDEFMQAVKDDTDYTLRFPIDSETPQIVKTVRAKELWDVVIKAAHTSAEPGLIFWDRQHKYSTSSIYPGFKNTSTNPCLTKDTWIMTTDGPKQIEELIGSQFTSFLNGSENVSTDEGFFKTGTKKIYKLTTKNGFEIKSTDNHPFKLATKINRKSIDSEMRELKDIKIGNYLCLSNDRYIAWDGKGNEEIGWMLGSLLGDGTITKNRAHLCYWGDSKFKMKETAISYLKNNLEYREGFLGEGSQNTYDIEVHDRTNFGSSDLKKTAEKFGITSDKKLNSKIEKTSFNFYKGFLSGWFDADGTINIGKEKRTSISLSSTILGNLKIAQRMLSRIGIISKIYENRKDSGLRQMPNGIGSSNSYFCNSTHELVISKDNIIEFYNKIGFLEPDKNKKLKSIIEEYNASPRGFYRERFVDVVTSIEEIGLEDVFDCTVYPDHEFEANGFIVHNCSEIAMQGGDSCRLIAMNLYGCVINPFTPDAYFDYDKFYEVTYESQRLMDDLVELELEAIERIIAKIKSDKEPEHIKQVEIDIWELLYKTGKKGRRTGLGFTALGDTLAAIGMPYDSLEALKEVDKMMRTKLTAEFDSSIDMAIERGKFDGYNNEIENTSEFVQMMEKEFHDVYSRMMKFGRRNISISTVAPTGSLSILAQTSSGLEPVFMLGYKRRKKILSSDKSVKVDFVDDMGDKWQEFPVYHPKLKTWMDITGETDETKSPYAGSTSPEIDWIKRVEMQSIIQKYITHSISSTINLPQDVSLEKVGEIYMKSWSMGLKGITVYRDGSRSGVLVSNDKKEETVAKGDVHAPKRPKSVDCDVLRFTNKGERWIGFVGILDGRPYEVFTGKAEGMKIPNYVDRGEIKKSKENDVSSYDFVYEDKDGVKQTEENLNRAFDKHYWNYAKLISGVLRHRMPLPSVVDLINTLNLDDDVITTWKNGVARMIKTYIPDGTTAGDKKCKNCGSQSVIYQESCLVCVSCGSSKCG